MAEKMIDIISCECLDSNYWRIKYRIGTVTFDDIFKRITRLGYDSQQKENIP